MNASAALGGDQTVSSLARLSRGETAHMANFPSVRQGYERTVFDALADAAVNLALLRRELPVGAEAWLQRWAGRRSDNLEQVISPSQFKLAPFLRGLEGPLRDWLTKDIIALIERFSRLSASKRVRVAFGPIFNNRCRKFHTDNLEYRLICTYAGPGTEWIPNEGVNREAMDCAVGCPDQANARVVRDQGFVQRASPGDVLVMKEDLHPHAPGLVHRSPPIEHLQVNRVALIVSTVDWQ